MTNSSESSDVKAAKIHAAALIFCEVMRENGFSNMGFTPSEGTAEAKVEALQASIEFAAMQANSLVRAVEQHSGSRDVN